ncbi:MAG: phosphatidylserine/phosphatidylglycerophosphate/cardiolipin synthase family protein [Deltaproteobacteria bacterium]|nr:phosphatidylserine/phosphatidylglycerophosphate/cardiolipin synthase family protein [Deltaproteobacteria bacterium]
MPAKSNAAKGIDGLDAPRSSALAKLTGEVPCAPQTAPPLSVAFDRIQAPGGPAQARVLSKNLDAWNARWEMVSSAKESIDANYFIFERDPFGYAFLGAMLKKQMAGVDVRVMTDAMADPTGEKGFKSRGSDYLEELVNQGGKAYVYHPVLSRGRDALFGNEYSTLASNHDKILVVDGQRSITGGRNISQDYLADPADHKGAWRDMDVALEGAETAAGLKQAFDVEVNQGAHVADPVTPDFMGNWDKKDIQLLGAAELMDLWLHDPVLSDAKKAELRANPEALKPFAADLVERALKRATDGLPANLKREPSDSDREFLNGLAADLVKHLEARGSAQTFPTGRLPERSTQTKILDQTSAAGTRMNNIAPALKSLVDSAKKQIVIENPYVVLTEDMLKSLESASARGVKIEIITNSPLSTDSKETQAFFLEDWPSILARCPTAKILVATGERKVHAKSAVIDGEESFVSTYNLDLLSGYVNSEVGAIVKSKEVATDLLAAFAADKADPTNGFIEYKIQRDANGKPALKDGKPVVEFGPEDHLSPEMIAEYAKRRDFWGNKVRENVALFEPLRHPPLVSPK